MSRDLDTDQKLCDAATPGPWTWTDELRQRLIATSEPADSLTDREIIRCAALLHPERSDAEFIAMAREALPWYIARVRELEAREQRRSTRPSDIDWQQRISRALGVKLGQITLPLNEATAEVETLLDRVTRLRRLVVDMTDPDECWFDHRGGCQAHGYLDLEPGELCPHAEAKTPLEGLSE